MADISKITIPNGNSTSTYNVKDASAVGNISRNGSNYTVTKRDGSTFSFDQQTYSAQTESVNLYTANGTITASLVENYSEGNAATLSKTDVSIPNVTDRGSLPTLTIPSTNYVATSWTKVKLGSNALTNTNFQNGVNANTSTTDYSLDLSQVLVGSDATPDTGTRINYSELSDLIDFDQGTLPTLGTAIDATKINSWITNTPTSLTSTDVSIPNISTTSKTLVTGITASN